MISQDTGRPASLDDVKGWFPKVDQLLFTWFLERQERMGQRGDLVELGSYLGKSAILMGRHLREGETFTVCDLFDSDAPDDSNQAEMEGSYSTLTRRGFESNYRAFHDELPEIIQGPTSLILDHVQPETCRFVHVDASHLYEHVHGDIRAAHVMLPSGGLIVCDDYRSEHTPGVSAAVWEAVAVDGLRPICVTTQKLYGTWGDSATVQDELLEWLRGREDVWHEVQEVAGRPLVRIKGKAAKKKNDGAKLKERLAQAEQRLARTEEKLARARHELEAVRGSVSFKVGRKLTALPRAVRGGREP
ncbi:class I SAM-dependent methyltransferase [Actinomadura madurae]|uniref:class I SAM-dependent methyltransferase n=1 Tax=Actinomadura madurae TaxID=1993 RepID=UPI0020275A96|nr:class I SAM-dependent methyltransferase [Actinomadura madurae]MCP9948499.1 class I SAM-dependent methyltransferase [Actinomadura madurae]MCP9965281.1 class I SAM-dependent methyltransferase [Actinomadura madurae]MCP9977769.1 class I SAM-dependent methyltransferase [Actinomadura madurae]MCQ0010736.1 class I SAM-dependent methyltransferase [Actinomadura madurae]URM94144.1 class I SAM-dependent methyltransferase [Actinomadura madurae]